MRLKLIITAALLVVTVAVGLCARLLASAEVRAVSFPFNSYLWLIVVLLVVAAVSLMTVLILISRRKKP